MPLIGKPAHSAAMSDVVKSAPVVVCGNMGGLLDLLHDTVLGRFPPADGTVSVIEEAAGPTAAVLGFTGHFAVCAPVEAAWVHAQLRPGDLSAPLGARFIVALADHLGAHIGSPLLSTGGFGASFGRGLPGLLGRL
jgi:hypothetical protein